MNRRNLLIRAGALAAVAGGAWWARDNILWPAPVLAFADGHASAWMPHARRANVPTVRARVAGQDIVALIDTGAQYSVVDRDWFATLPNARRSIFEIPMVAYGVGGGAQMGRGTTLDVEADGLSISGLRAAVLDLGPLATSAGLQTPLILGRDVLRRAVLALDPARRFVRLIAPDAFVRPQDMVAVPVTTSAGALVVSVAVEGRPVRAVLDTGASSLLALDRSTAETAGLLDGRPTRVASSLVLGGAMRAMMIEARAVTFAGQTYEEAEIGVFDQPPLPNFPGALLGMAAFADRRAAIDLGAEALHVARTPDLKVVA